MEINPDHLGQPVATEDGSVTMSHPEHGECYHSRTGAEAEARELYVKSSGIEAGFASAVSPIAVLDVGLGLGYNALATLDAWLAAEHPPALEMASLEVDEPLVVALTGGDAPWQSNWSASRRTICTMLEPVSAKCWRASLTHPRSHAVCHWSIHLGDARTQPLPSAPLLGWTYVWQDPFSPEKNPGMWDAAWFAKVAASAATPCTLVTYSVARAVREALSAAGWSCAKIPAAQRSKRHWLRASMG